jgi:hypothetical protein
VSINRKQRLRILAIACLVAVVSALYACYVYPYGGVSVPMYGPCCGPYMGGPYWGAPYYGPYPAVGIPVW